MKKGIYMGRHPVLVNVVIIILVAALGVAIVFLSLNIFTRHGQWATVPEVEDISYTDAIKILHESGFRTDIRDSIYNEDIRPGFVVEQFPKPGATVKPGRKIFLYINAVNPKQVLIDPENKAGGNALEGFSLRQAQAKLEELGFKDVRIKTVPGTSDRVIRLIANGKTVMKMQKVAINSPIIIEVYDGQLRKIQDSILEKEYLQYVEEEGNPYEYLEDDYPENQNHTQTPSQSPAQEPEAVEETPEPAATAEDE